MQQSVSSPPPSSSSLLPFSPPSPDDDRSDDVEALSPDSTRRSNPIPSLEPDHDDMWDKDEEDDADERKVEESVISQSTQGSDSHFSASGDNLRSNNPPRENNDSQLEKNIDQNNSFSNRFQPELSNQNIGEISALSPSPSSFKKRNSQDGAPPTPHGDDEDSKNSSDLDASVVSDWDVDSAKESTSTSDVANIPAATAVHAKSSVNNNSSTVAQTDAAEKEIVDIGAQKPMTLQSAPSLVPAASTTIASLESSSHSDPDPIDAVGSVRATSDPALKGSERQGTSDNSELPKGDHRESEITASSPMKHEPVSLTLDTSVLPAPSSLLHASPAFSSAPSPVVQPSVSSSRATSPGKGASGSGAPLSIK